MRLLNNFMIQMVAAEGIGLYKFAASKKHGISMDEVTPEMREAVKKESYPFLYGAYRP
tara:strand:+ start:350 stop:523 length:174 start_codon:yes stop_codon:yes gene_type:complete